MNERHGGDPSGCLLDDGGGLERPGSCTRRGSRAWSSCQVMGGLELVPGDGETGLLPGTVGGGDAWRSLERALRWSWPGGS